MSLTIGAGEFIAIVGQNGSGKTTLAKMAVGLLAPDSGTILLEGRDRTTLRPAETAREIGYVFQNPDHQIFADSVEAEVKFGPRNFGLDDREVESRCAEVLQAVGLENERATDPFLLGKGQRQRLAVASVLALRPRLLILDEPTTGLDYREQRKMMKLVSELNAAGVAIVMITHTPWLVAEYARRVILMRAGRKLFDGPVREFFVQDELLRDVVVQATGSHHPGPSIRHRRIERDRAGGVPERRAMKTSLYIDRGSVVHRLHPTLKIFGLFAAFWSIYWIDNPLTLVPFIVAEFVVAAAIGAGPNLYRFRWFFVLIVLPTMITWMISYRKGVPIINLPIIHASKESILFGLGKGMKVAALVLASVLFLSSTKVEELSVGLSRLGFPYRFGFTITLAFRLVPLFIDSALTVVDAQRLRGYDFDAGGPFERVRRYVPVIIPVFMGALRKANNMAMALEARGFGRDNAPTSFIEYRMHPRDAEAFVVLLAVGTIAFILYWTGYGAIPGASIHS